MPQLALGRGWRGGQRQTLLLAGGLADRGVRAPVVAPPGAEILERAAAAGLETVPLPALGEMDPLGALRIARLEKRLGTDALHAHNATSHGVAALARLLGRGSPLIVTRRSLQGRVGAASRLKYVSGAERYIAISRAVAEDLARLGVPLERITVIPSAVALPAPGTETPVDWHRRLDLPADARVVGSAGALSGEKDYATLIRAVALLDPSVHLAIAGDGPLRTALLRLAADLGVDARVHLPGHLEEIGDGLRGMEVYAQPSAREGLGTAVMEAMARGVPVVASAVGGLVDLVADGETGLLVPAGDPAALAGALRQLLESPELRERLAASALAAVERLSPQRLVERTLEVYRCVLRRRGTAR